MKTFRKFLITLSISLLSSIVFGQNKDDAQLLVKQGIALHDEGKYSEAIDKYKEAIKIDSESYQAYYEISFSLYASGKEKEAIPYLEKAVSPKSPYKADGYDLLGNIFDDDHQSDKAIEYYKEGIKANPQYQRLYFNVGITYLRQKKYAEAEAYAIDAIKLDPKHASSQRVYALATYGQDKRGESLLAWCSFLLLEPQTKRTEEAFRYVQKLLNYGIVRTGEKSVTINVNANDMESPNFLMPMTVLAATSDKTGLTRADSLTLQLKSIFEISGNFAGKKGDPFYKSFFSDYFKGLSTSDNMPAFARFISISIYKEENIQWFKDNDSKLSALDNWVANTQRKFE